MTEKSSDIIKYEESWMPPFAPVAFFLPMFYKYSVIVTEKSITFGYGFTKQPWGLTSQTLLFSDIKKESIATGDATWKDNLTKYGGWGLRLAFNGTVAYNAKNGPYIELQSTAGKKFVFVSKDVEKVAALLRGDA